MKIMMFGFDGLRPDCINADDMPNLYAFLQENVLCADHRAVYPTETYVNHPSILTGFLPEQHGIIANAFYDAAVSRKDFFLGSNVSRIEHFERMTHGRLFRVPSVTEQVSRSGRSCLTLSSNSPGSTRLMGHKSAVVGGVNIAVHNAEFALPEAMREKLAEYHSNGPVSLPDNEGSARIARIFRSLCKNIELPDLSILWFGEPDHSFHRYGIRDEKSRDALKAADRCFGELYSEFAAGKEDVQVITASDHGHITVKRHFDLKDGLVQAGFRSGETLEDPDADFVLLWGYSGNIYVQKQERLASLCRALMEMPEIGMLFTRDRNGVDGIIPGTFSRRLVGGEFETRAGDIRFIMRYDSDENCVCSAPIPAGAGIHGGLSRGELSCLLGFGGSAFLKKTRLDTVTGAIDIAPVMYAVLGMTPEVLPQGRVITEAFRPGVVPQTAITQVKGNTPDSEPERKYFSVGLNGYEQYLDIDYRNRIPYIKQGGRM